MGGGCCIGDCCIGDCGFCCVVDWCCIFDSGCGDCSFSSSTKPKGVDRSKEIADKLAEMNKKAVDDAAKDEGDIRTDISKNFAALLNELEKINLEEYNGHKLNINIDNIKKKNDKLLDEVNGFIAKRMADRLVPTDKELAIILNETDAAKFKKNFDDFYKRLHKDAKGALEKRIRETGKEQKEIIEEAIRQRRDEVNSSLERMEDEFRTLLAAHEKGMTEVLRRKIDFMYQLDVSNIALDQLKAAEKA